MGTEPGGDFFRVKTHSPAMRVRRGKRTRMPAVYLILTLVETYPAASERAPVLIGFSLGNGTAVLATADHKSS